MSTTTASEWREVPERGSATGIAVVVKLATLFGRWPARLFVRVLVFYYALFFGTGRRAVNNFLRRVGERTGFWAAYRQMRRFADVVVDALFFVQGKLDHFELSRDGSEHLRALERDGKGAVLLGAHIGSFYAMRAASREERLPLHPLVYTKNAQRINAALRRLDPGTRTELIEMDEGDVGFMLRVRDAVERGGIVAILADRAPKGGKTVTVDFLGAPAELPIGPYVLAASLRCPVYFTCGIYRHPNRYELHCEPFAERIELPRATRMEAIREHAQRYADRLAHYCRSAPDNWFNFYDFWGKGPADK
jgi:predicted LPLAT superfamily acyltransferase